MSPTVANIAWGIILGAGALLETWTLLNRTAGDTLSERTRAWWHTHTWPGRAAFTVGWAGFAVWFPLHILTQQM